MTDLELVLLGVALGAIPTASLGRLALAWLAKRAGLEPQEIREYSNTTEEDENDDSD